jgi:nucleoside-diphosphate-sugar epimerase
MRIVVTGGCGYIGTCLTEDLLKNGFKVIVIDNQWFGNYLKRHKNLKVIKKDIREINDIKLKNIYAIVHLANIANDPGVDLNPTLSWEVNVLATKYLLEKAKKLKVKKFIYASSGSVYGIKKEKKVTEELDLVPISTYNKTKMIAEKIIKSYENDMKVYCIRPATVCGYSPRMRLDVSVNALTFQALNKKEINVFGGSQVRPNIHMKDMVRVYLHFIKKNIKPGVYNAGFENLSILNLARKIKDKINCKISITRSNDPRSYRQNSDKLIRTGFKKKYSINDAIDEITFFYKKKKIKNKKICFTVKCMNKLKL